MTRHHRRLVVLAASLVLASAAWANHPVLVEGNCDSPVPGTTLVAPGACGDFYGDGRIGTAEDTDGADRIFGTISAALGPGTGAAAGTGANNNGQVTIVTSGRFAEQLIITGASATPPTPAVLGDVTLQAAPGVDAIVDAVLQGDPSGGNPTRLGQAGIVIVSSAGRRVIVRNLTVRNFFSGFDIGSASQATLINVRVQNNAHYGIRVRGTAEVLIGQSDVIATGFRVGSGGTNHPASPPVPGAGIVFQNSASGAVYRTSVSGNFGGGILDQSTGSVTLLDNYLFNN